MRKYNPHPPTLFPAFQMYIAANFFICMFKSPVHVPSHAPGSTFGSTQALSAALVSPNKLKISAA